jgi:signal peptidase I
MIPVRSSIADWEQVPTGSMKPSFLECERVFVNKLAYDLKVPLTTWHLAQWSNPKWGLACFPKNIAWLNGLSVCPAILWS